MLTAAESKQLRKLCFDKNVLLSPMCSDKEVAERLAKAYTEEKLPTADFLEVAAIINKAVQPPKDPIMPAPTLADLSSAAGSNGGGVGSVRTIDASERYSKSTTPVLNKSTGQPLVIFGQPVHTPSEASYARIGAWMKHYLRSHADTLRKWDMRVPDLNDHEKQLLQEVYYKGHFCGEMNKDRYVDRATAEECGLNVKALLDDATSGGQALVPYELDLSIVSPLYLHSQFLPDVDMRTVGSSEVKVSSFGAVTVSWGTAEGTEIPLFNTDSLISEASVPINPVAAAIEYGKDFESDTPIADFGRFVSDQFSEAMLKELDRAICLGTGTNQPEGFLVAAGTTGVNADNGSSGPPTMNDYIKLLFAVPKAYREANLMPVFASNDTSYMRSRQIKIDTATPSTDQRPVFGIEGVEDYTTLGHSHRICNSIGNRVAAMVCLKKYRLYRRPGIDMQVIEQDLGLARANKKALIVRSRYGGKLVDASACAVIADGQS